MKISKSNVVKGFCTILLLGILAVSCRQDPIFHIISTETAPIPPLIEGGPTNMVVFEREYLSDPANPASEIKRIPLLFVASGKLHWYGRPQDTGESPRWDRNYGIPQPKGKVISLAVSQERLYALCLSGNSLTANLRYLESGYDKKWQTISRLSEYSLIQSIYVDPETGQLFAGARRRSSTAYALLYLDGTDTLQILKRETAMLSGAACRDNVYYLSTRGQGIFQVSKTDLETNNINDATVLQLTNISFVEVVSDAEIDPEADPDAEIDPDILIERRKKNSNMIFMGMIKLEDQSIIAIGRSNGTLYEILADESGGAYYSQMYYINNETGKNGNSIGIGSYATCAVAQWVDTDRSIKKLVAGRQGTLYSTSYNNGYVEFTLDYNNGSFNKYISSRHMDTVHDSDRYSTNLGKHPINHLFQAPREIDPDMTFFASTQTAGLWSYRNRPNNGGWQWNAEN